MDEDKWISVLITALVGSFVVCFLILIINQSDKRGQALTWLPASLAATLAVTYMNSPNELPRLLETAFGSILISGTFIFSFFGILDVILPGEKEYNIKRWHLVEKRITDAKNQEKQRAIELETYKDRQKKNSTLLAIIITFSLIIPGLVVWAVEKYANPFWSLVAGFFGLGIVTVNVMVSKTLKFSQHKFQVKLCSGCKQVPTAEKWMLFGAVLGTFAFVIIPAWLTEDLDASNWAGIVSNAPKVSVLIMVSIYIKATGNLKAALTPRQEIEIRQEIKEHLTMFSYSTGISALYILCIWFNEEQVAPIADILGLNTTDTDSVSKGPENFWAAWGVAFFLSLIFIAGILVPLIWPDRSGELKLAKLLPEDTSSNGPRPLAPMKPAGQGGKVALLKRPALKW
jgi:glycerol uptake facilitator-like aquaporin